MTYIAVALGLGLMASLVCVYYYKGQADEMAYRLSTAKLVAASEKDSLEAMYKQELKHSNDTAERQIKEIEDKYQRLIVELNAHSDESDDLDGVHQSSGGNGQTGAAAITCKPCPACPVRSHGQDSATAQRATQLEAELLAVSKDCDAVAVRFNTLLKLYESYRKESQNGKN